MKIKQFFQKTFSNQVLHIAEVFYCEAPTFTPEDKQYFVKLVFEREGTEVVLNHKKSFPEIQTPEDVDTVINSVQNSIVLMDTNPQFFMIGVLKKELRKSFKNS